jgi:hypothetical protein
MEGERERERGERDGEVDVRCRLKGEEFKESLYDIYRSALIGSIEFHHGNGSAGPNIDINVALYPL